MHVHASDKKLTEAGSAKFFVKSNGDTELQHRGILNDYEVGQIQKYIKRHYKEMYEIWSEDSDNGFYDEF
jgi:Tol biopolymer transport system component